MLVFGGGTYDLSCKSLQKFNEWLISKNASQLDLSSLGLSENDGNDDMSVDEADESEKESEKDPVQPARKKAVSQEFEVECDHKVDDIGEILLPDGALDMRDFLNRLAMIYVKRACSKKDILSLNLPHVLGMASLCAGAGTGELTFRAAVSQLSDHFLKPIQAKLLFTCEKEVWKQNHLINGVLDADDKDVCVYDDVMTLGAVYTRPQPPNGSLPEVAEVATKGRSKGKKEVKDHSTSPPHCVHHKKSCPLPQTQVFMLKSGFSCKGNSKMNIRFAEYRNSMLTGDLSNTSVSTFYGTLSIIASTKPKIFILENVDSIGSEHQQDSNLSKVLAELRTVDEDMYAVHVYSLCTESFLLPQSRTESNDDHSQCCRNCHRDFEFCTNNLR